MNWRPTGIPGDEPGEDPCRTPAVAPSAHRRPASTVCQGSGAEACLWIFGWLTDSLGKRLSDE
jgi:hypothetical protein